MTLITMEERKSGIAPLCNSFSKNAIKERIISIMKIKKTSLIAILAAFILITGITAPFTTTAVSGASPLAPIPNTPFEEPRMFRFVTAEDYESLFTLKTKDYQNMTVAAFDELYLQWCNENFDRMEIIKEDAFRNDYRIPLTGEEKYFAAFTATRLSGEENYRRIQSLREGKPEEDPVYRERLSPRQVEENGLGAWCRLDYIFTYHIKDKEVLTIGERDRCIGEFVNEVRKFWEETDIDERALHL